MQITNIWGEFLNTLEVQATYIRLILDFLHIIFDNIFYFLLYIFIGISAIYVIFTIISMIWNPKYKERKLDFSKAPTVTIQIPTRNEIIALRCARKCLEFDYPKDRFKIMIGDDSNDAEVSAEIDAFAAKHDQITVIRRKDNIGFKPGNLNNMLKHTKSDIIVIFDSDFVPGKDFLKRIVAPFTYDKDVAAVQSRWKFLNSRQNFITVLGTTIQSVVHYIFLPIMATSHVAFLCGSGEAVRRSTLVKLGGWRSGALTEDIEYSLRLHRNTKKVVYLDNLPCLNELPDSLKDLYKQQMRWAYGVIAAYKMHSVGVMRSSYSMIKKIYAFCMAFGYLTPIFILLLVAFGVLSFVTHPPGPLDVVRFLTETGRNILVTFGLMVASVIALLKAKQMKIIWKSLLSSFSIGFVITYFVNVGIFKALFNKPMQWFLLKKSKDYLND
ncbi:glycosyltransferase [Candidatus Woesearchaeota archaeon]|nr:glycosyltransferase [Candidatus Woesearchaeota archaeon]